MKHRKNKLALVCTAGGHFEQMTNLENFYRKYDRFWITNHNKQTVSTLTNEIFFFVKEAHYKKPWTYLRQVPKMLRIFLNEKPTHVVSTGSGRTAFIPFLIAKLMGVKFLYIDTFSRVNGYSKFGTFLLKIGHPIYSQWEESNYHKVQYIGPVFNPVAECQKEKKNNHVFVTLGTRSEAFTRLIESADKLVQKEVIKEKTIVQAGHTKYRSENLELFDFCTPDQIDDFIINAKYVITQESAGIGTKCLKYKTKFIVMPRDYKYGELPSKSDMNEDLHLRLSDMGYTKVVNNVEELEKAIREIENLTCGFKFDNSLAIETLTKSVEGK